MFDLIFLEGLRLRRVAAERMAGGTIAWMADRHAAFESGQPPCHEDRSNWIAAVAVLAGTAAAALWIGPSPIPSPGLLAAARSPAYAQAGVGANETGQAILERGKQASVIEKPHLE